MALVFEDAVREQVKMKAALIGPNGSGKTRGALTIASAISTSIVVIDTEKDRSKLFADRFTFKHARLADHTPEAYAEAARDAAELVGPDGVVIFDSLSHEWLEVLTQADRFADWKDLTPRHREAMQTIVDLDCHVIVTMRSKIKYSVTEVEVEGRTKPRQVIERIGIGPVQREGIEYEFDILAYLDTEYYATFTNRCDPLVGKTLPIDDATCAIIVQWLAEGDPPPPPPPFDPETELLPEAIRGEGAARAIADGLMALMPHVDLALTLDQLAHDVYDVAGSKEIRGDRRMDWMRRLSNATAKLAEGGDFPPPTDAQIVEAFSFAFSGHVLELVFRDLEPDPEDAVSDSEEENGEAALGPREPVDAQEASGELASVASDDIPFGDD